MINKANEITGTQVFTYIISAQVGLGILSVASTLAEKLGHDGWITMLISGLITFFLIYMVVATLKRYKNKSILDINNYLFGKYVGTFLNILVVVYFAYTATITLRLFSDVIKLSTLKFTPAVVITCFVMLPIVYLSWYGLKYICRFSSMKIIIFVIVIAYYMLLSKYFRLSFLMPFGEAGASKILKNCYNATVSYLGYEMLAVIYPYVKDKKNILKFAMLGNLVSLSFYIITVVFLTGFFGEIMLKQLQYPIFSLARAYRAPVLERLDLFFISLWFPIMLITVLTYFFSAYNCLYHVFKAEDNRGQRKLLLAVLTVLIISCSRIPKDMIMTYKLLEYVGYAGTALILYIILCYFFSFLKPGGKKNENTT